MRVHLASRNGRLDARRREPGGGDEDAGAIHQGDSLVVDDEGQLGLGLREVNTRPAHAFHSFPAWPNSNNLAAICLSLVL
jgi:hypothetical protein